jgi:cold-inducible RNA-binding protein
MGKKLYVGNLPFSADDNQLGNHFAQFGQVTSANIIIDRATGRSKGFGFVEMESDSEADKAIEQLNGTDFGGRNMTVSEARPQEPRGDRPRFGGGGRDGGGGGNRGPRGPKTPRY